MLSTPRPLWLRPPWNSSAKGFPSANALNPPCPVPVGSPPLTKTVRMTRCLCDIVIVQSGVWRFVQWRYVCKDDEWEHAHVWVCVYVCVCVSIQSVIAYYLCSFFKSKHNNENKPWEMRNVDRLRSSCRDTHLYHEILDRSMKFAVVVVALERHGRSCVRILINFLFPLSLSLSYLSYPSIYPSIYLSIHLSIYLDLIDQSIDR